MAAGAHHRASEDHGITGEEQTGTDHQPLVVCKGRGGPSAEQPATGKKMGATGDGQSNQGESDDEDEKLKGLSRRDRAQYKGLEKQVAEIVRDPKGELS